MPGFFITGTDTGVGKTLVAESLLRLFAASGLRAVGMKPVSSGATRTTSGLRNADALALQAVSSASPPYEKVNPYVFAPAIAPHLAAAEDGVTIELARILAAYQWLSDDADVMVVEGVGGWLVPLADDLQQPGLALALGLPVVLVVGLRLGCLNHAQLSARAIRDDGLMLAGWVANAIDPDFERAAGNLATLKDRLHAPFLGDIPWRTGITAEAAGERLDAQSLIKLLENAQAG